jgi:hypothetical protein
MFHTHSYDNDHLCFNPSINHNKTVRIHIFIFLCENWPLYVTLTLAIGTWILHTALWPTMVNICTKLFWNPFTRVDFLAEKRFSMTYQSNLDLCHRELIRVQDNVSYSNTNVYEVSFESLHMYRRYALDKISFLIIFCDLDLSYITRFTSIVKAMIICVLINQYIITEWSEYTFTYFYLNFDPMCDLELGRRDLKFARDSLPYNG